MIRFEHEDVRLTNAFLDEFGSVTEIGKKTDFGTVRAQHKTDGIVGVVRNGERFDTDIADFEGSAGAEKAEIEFGGFELKFDRFLGEAITKNRDGQFIAERAETVGVIGMLVGEQDAAETFGSATDLREALANLFRAKSGVDEETRVAVFEVSAISVRSTAKDRELYRQ